MNEKNFFRNRKLTTNEKIQAAIGWIIIGVVGAACYKAGERSAQKNTDQ